MRACLAACFVVSANAVTLNEVPIRRLGEETRDTALKLMREDATLLTKQATLRKVQTESMREWLKSETVRQVTEAAASAASGEQAASAGAFAGLGMNPQEVVDAFIEGGQEDSFVKLTDHVRTEVLNSTAKFVTDVEFIIRNFVKTTANASSQVTVPLVANLFELLRSKLKSQQDVTMTLVDRVKRKLPEALKPTMGPLMARIRESANPFNIDSKTWAEEADKQNMCDGISMVKAGLRPYLVNLRDAHASLNAASLTLASANQNPKALLLPRFASLGFFEVLSLEHVGTDFLQNAMPLIEEKLECGPSTGHVLEAPYLTQEEENIQRKAKADEAAVLVKKAARDAYATALTKRLEAKNAYDVSDLKQALLNFRPVRDEIDDIQEKITSIMNKFYHKMAYYRTDSKNAARSFVVAATSSTSDEELATVFRQFANRVEELWQTRSVDALALRKKIPALFAKGMRRHLPPFLNVPSANRSMFSGSDQTQSAICQTIESAIASALEYRSVILDDLKKLDRNAASAKGVGSSPVEAVLQTSLPNMMSIAYSDALTVRDAIKDTLQIVGPVVLIKYRCSKVRDALDNERWWSQRATANH